MRVSEKFLEFINKFPDFLTLSEAPLEYVLKAWQGLGYNRRAIALKKIAEIVLDTHDGKLPDSIDVLKSFPQIGHNTASSIMAFAFNLPTVFIETNIRRVFIYFFFRDKNLINDKDILPLVENTLDKKNPREWYYALMDYGVMLKKKFPDLNKKSSHYRKQSPFKGSNRQLRGQILKILIEQAALKELDLRKALKINNIKKLREILDQLEKEGFIEREDSIVRILKQ
jgi:A/G-specific adenine glycosylase